MLDLHDHFGPMRLDLFDHVGLCDPMILDLHDHVGSCDPMIMLDHVTL